MRAGERIRLTNEPMGAVDLAEVMRSRRSVRAWAPQPPTLRVVGRVLALSAADTGITRSGLPRRSVPSAGALRLVKLHLLNYAVDGIPAGAFAYDPHDHALVLSSPLPPPDIRKLIPELDTRPPGLIVFVAVPDIGQQKYGPRATTFALLEAGALAHAIDLALVAHGLGTLWIGGIAGRPMLSTLAYPQAARAYPVVGLAFGTPLHTADQ